MLKRQIKSWPKKKSHKVTRKSLAFLKSSICGILQDKNFTTILTKLLSLSTQFVSIFSILRRFRKNVIGISHLIGSSFGCNQFSKGPILLVGTHLDKVTPQHVSLLQDFVEKNLRSIQRRFDFQIRYNGDKPFFGVNNTEQRRGIDDTLNLQTTLSLVTDELYPMKTEHPIRWWQFLMFVHEKCKHVSTNVANQSSLIVNVQTLCESFPSIEITELTRIFKYFHDFGEIIFDEICQLVCFDMILNS